MRLLQGRRIESAEKNELYEEKKSVTYKEQDALKVAEYLDKIKDIPPDTIAYIDETGIDRYIYRQRAWSLRGTPVYGKVSGRKYRRTGIAAVLIRGVLAAPMRYDGTMDGELFEAWFRDFLCPEVAVRQHDNNGQRVVPSQEES
ncbi:transposase [Synergistes jonesii]|uniref:transposase n=1 Tax=Synergistes jonesii TaxID=2754 RepID=UPI0038B34D2A